MTIQLRKAERLCSAAELNLVKAALAPALRKLDEKQLAAHLTRARRTRDKYRDLLKRQRLSAREKTGQKGGRSGDANARTREKGELFEEVLERFEARSADMSARAGRESGEKASKSSTKKRAASKASAESVTAKKKGSKKEAAKKAAKKTAKKAAKKAAKKSAKKRSTDEIDEPIEERSPSNAARKPGPAVRTPAERVADKVRANPQRMDVDQRTDVDRQAIDPGVTDRQGARFVSDRAKIAAQTAGSQGAREQAIHGHVASAGRRNQAKRDKK